MPDMEHAGNAKRWLAGLEGRVSAAPNGTSKTVYELQTVSWRSKEPLDTRVVSAEMHELQNSGALHLAYYPDDFVHNNPNVGKLSPAFSAAAYPDTSQVPAASIR